jgi:hypothetical protein
MPGSVQSKPFWHYVFNVPEPDEVALDGGPFHSCVGGAMG